MRPGLIKGEAQCLALLAFRAGAAGSFLLSLIFLLVASAGFPSFGSSGPVTTISGISGVHLIAGNRYYLRTTADTDSVDAWNFNALGISGQVLHAQGNPDIQEFSAFDIIGTPTAAVPGPVVGAGLPGLLLAGSALLAWWCKKWKATAVAG